MKALPKRLSLAERMRGLLLGGAVGDALGAPVEFMSREEILAEFGPDGITDFAPAYGRIGAITDDTQMMLFTLEGLIRAKVRKDAKGICHTPGVVDHAYQRWFATQSRASPPADQKLDGWLIQQPELWSRRAPGNTCLAALAAKAGKGFGEPAVNNSKGAGGIMRVGPVGLVPLVKDMKTSDLAGEIAALTHGHPTSTEACGWFAEWTAQLSDNQALRKPVDAALAAYRWTVTSGSELDRALTTAFELANRGYAPVVPAALGEGWIAEEAAAIALWCVLVAPDALEALRLAVNINGDSDTTGVLVGQVLGAAYGIDWIPPAMLERLELREAMEKLAADAGRIIDGRFDVDEVWGEYPGW